MNFVRRIGKRGTVVAASAALLIIGIGVWFFCFRADRTPQFRSVPIKRGDLVATISATGTVEPIASVDVGTQVAGVIIAFGKDKNGNTVNWGSVVDAGTVLAKIDDSLYAAAVRTATAQVEAAEANVLQMKAKLLQATQDWDRARRLGPSDALSQSAYDQYHANYEVARANVASAIASVRQAKATLSTAQINLNYCTIKSPVKGVIIDRRVNIGQTVVSSLNAPSLFLIANDLKRIQVWVSVNEADVGYIFQDMPVTFTVDAFPGKTFHGKVGQVRLNATMTQNVVTYTIAVDTDNSDGKLLPYLTANAQFEIGRRKDALLVPNAALRWSPRPEQVAPDSRKHSREKTSRRDRGGDAAGTRATIWIDEGRFVRPVRVSVGLTDGAFTEVEGKDLKEGIYIVVGEGTRQKETASTTERNPFAPQVFRGQRSGQGRGQDQAPGTQDQAPPPGPPGNSK